MPTTVALLSEDEPLADVAIAGGRPNDGNKPGAPPSERRLVDGCRRLQRVVVALAAHLVPSQPAELLMDDGYQLVERGPIPTAPGEQQLSHVRTRPVGRGGGGWR